jgi:predicted amidohydrolase YtcJ
LALALVTLVIPAHAPAHADVLIDNVDGFTLDTEGKIQRFTGLLVGDDGRIEQVLRRGEKRPGKVDYAMNGKGRVVMPGFVDGDFDLMGFGFSLVETTSPNAQPRPEDRDLALAKAQQALLQRGVTAVTDMGTTIEDWQTYRRAGDLGALAIRVMAYAEGVDAMILIGGPGPTPWLYDDRLRLNGVKLTLDGPLARQEALLKAPYADAPQKKQAPRLSDTQLKNLMSRAAMDNFQPAIQAHGDRAVAMTLNAVAEMVETYRGDRRWRLQGVETVDAADLARLAGVVVAASPQQLEASRQAAETRLGPARLAGAYAWKSLADAGAKLAFGISPPDPFGAIAAAITRSDAQDQPFGGWQPQERLTREAALAALTTGPAWAGFADGRFGRLAQGQRADFLILDRDPMLATPTELRATHVLETWVGGKQVYRAKDVVPAAPAANLEAGR